MKNLYDDRLADYAESPGEYTTPSEIWRGIAAGAASFAVITGVLGLAVWAWRAIR